MNVILPRINPHEGGERRIVLPNGGNHPMGMVRGVHSVLPRLGGGVPAKVVLANAGIKRGPLVRVKAWDAAAEKKGIEEAAKRKAAKEAEEKRRAEARAKVPGVKLVEKPKEKVEWVAKGMTAKEERLTDLLEAAQEMKPLADGVTDDMAEEQASATEPYDDPEYMKEQVVEEKPMPPPESLPEEVVERAEIIPEAKAEADEEKPAVSVEQPRKKRRGRKGKKARAAMMAAEQELL